MYDIHTIDEKNLLVDNIEEINMETDVIISIPETLDIIKFNIDGSIGICPDTPINMSFAKQITGFIPSHREMKKKLPVKLYIPYGYFPKIEVLPNISYLDIKTSYRSYSGFIYDKEFDVKNKHFNIYSKTPNYIVYTDIVLQLHINSDLCKKENPVMLFDTELPFCKLNIYKNFANNFGSGKIYYVKNNEVFFKLAETI